MDDPIHELLLRLAGRLDDDLLADARELVAVGEDGHALELVTAALAADATPLPPPVRAELVNAAAAARIDLDADAALAPAAPDTTAHRFSATAAADVPVVAAVRELPNRLREGVRLRLTWRQTPAGPVPTPLPQPVLLVETAADGRPGEVLAYQVGAAMARSGVHVAVEVLTSGRPLTSYHAAALRDSTPLSGDAPLRPASPPEKVESVVAEVVQQVTESHRNAPPEDAHDERPVDLFAVDEPAPRPVPMRGWQSGRRRRGFGEQVAEAEVDDDLPEADDHEPLPSPVPLARRTRPRPVGEVVEQPDPLRDPIPNEGTWTDEWASGDWAVAEDAPPPGPGGLTTAGGSAPDPHSTTAEPRRRHRRTARGDHAPRPDADDTARPVRRHPGTVGPRRPGPPPGGPVRSPGPRPRARRTPPRARPARSQARTTAPPRRPQDSAWPPRSPAGAPRRRPRRLPRALHRPDGPPARPTALRRHRSRPSRPASHRPPTPRLRSGRRATVRRTPSPSPRPVRSRSSARRWPRPSSSRRPSPG